MWQETKAYFKPDLLSEVSASCSSAVSHASNTTVLSVTFKAPASVQHPGGREGVRYGVKPSDILPCKVGAVVLWSAEYKR